MKVQAEHFGTINGQEITLFRIYSDSGHEWSVTNFGGILHQWICPDTKGDLADILLGCASLQDYMAGHPYFGAIVGRYANRIAYGRFLLDGTEYSLATNSGRHHLHGGKMGFDKKIWSFETKSEHRSFELHLSYLSPHLQEGYPGNLNLKVIYQFGENGSVTIKYHAVTDQPTHINLTNHCYFNLSGDFKNRITDHIQTIKADYITETDNELIPTGNLINVSGTPFDFRKPVRIGERINAENNMLSYGSGYDHNYVLNNPGINKAVAVTYHPSSGRMLEVFTDQPGLQLYTGNHLKGVNGKSGPYYNHSGMCLETQHFPDSPNHPSFPSTLISPGESYDSVTMYKLTVD